MTEHNKQQKTSEQRGQDQTNDPGRPSQAEGDRATVEESLREQGQGGQRQPGSSGTSGAERSQADDPKRPSKAEGERQAVEESLREKS